MASANSVGFTDPTADSSSDSLYMTEQPSPRLLGRVTPEPNIQHCISPAELIIPNTADDPKLIVIGNGRQHSGVPFEK
jgi:hypothetical protein